MTSVISEKLESIFSKNNELLLKFDRGYTDFYDTYKLFSDNVFFVSDIPSPAGNEYTLDNAVVIKRKGWIKILDVINKRKGPSINSQLAFISIGDIVLSEYLLVDFGSGISLAFPGEKFEFDAVSTNLDEIDGHRAPWYHIIIPMDHFFSYAWVYGGYVEEIISFIYDAHEDNETNRNKAGELFNRGFVNEKYLERFN